MQILKNLKNIVKGILVLNLILLAAAACQKTPDSTSPQTQPSQAQLNTQASKVAPTPTPQSQSIQKFVSVQASIDPKIYLVGNITFHATNFVNKYIKITGYMIVRENGYIIFSDEKVDPPNPHDLPVSGPGLDTILPLHKYILTGQFVYGGLKASNNNPYHLEVTDILAVN